MQFEFRSITGNSNTLFEFQVQFHRIGKNFGVIRVSVSRSLVSEDMITRSKLVEQLRDYQIRSQHKCPGLIFFSPKPHITSWADVAVASLWAFLFCVLLVSSYVTLYYRHFWLSFVVVCIGILLPIRLRIARQTLAKKKDRRLSLPLSM